MSDYYAKRAADYLDSLKQAKEKYLKNLKKRGGLEPEHKAELIRTCAEQAILLEMAVEIVRRSTNEHGN